MPKCDSCGNDYDKTFQIVAGCKSHTFDSFECAIQALAPTYEHCGVRIVGHGLEKDGRMFCCDHCAQHEGVTELRDRAGVARRILMRAVIALPIRCKAHKSSYDHAPRLASIGPHQ